MRKAGGTEADDQGGRPGRAGERKAGLNGDCLQCGLAPRPHRGREFSGLYHFKDACHVGKSKGKAGNTGMLPKRRYTYQRNSGTAVSGDFGGGTGESSGILQLL